MASSLKIGEILVKQGLLRPDQLATAIEEQKKTFQPEKPEQQTMKPDLKAPPPPKAEPKAKEKVVKEKRPEIDTSKMVKTSPLAATTSTTLHHFPKPTRGTVSTRYRIHNRRYLLPPDPTLDGGAKSF